MAKRKDLDSDGHRGCDSRKKISRRDSVVASESRQSNSPPAVAPSVLENKPINELPPLLQKYLKKQRCTNFHLFA
jgi:hypothetical protein